MVTPFVAVAGYLFGALALVEVSVSTGISIAAALGLLLLGIAAVLVRPDQDPVAWLISRPNRWTVVGLGVVIVGFPFLVGLSRRIFIALGFGADAALALSTCVGTAIVGAVAFHLSRREGALRESVEADRILLRANADGMLDPQVLLEADRDADGRVRDLFYRNVNRATCDYFGLSEHDLLGKSAFDTLPNLDGSGLLGHLAICLQDGLPVVLPDFSYFHDEPGAPRRHDIRATRAGNDLISLTWSDVTDRYLTARRMADSEQKYRLLAENVGDVVSHIRDDAFVWISPSVEGALGAPPEYWLGRRVAGIMPAEDATAHAERWTELGEGGAFQGRVQLRAVDGALHWVHLHAKPFHGADGRQDGVTAAFRLVDDEVAAQQAVESARRAQARADQRYRRSMENSAVGMCLITPDGRFEEVNDALCRVFGYDADTLRRKTWQELTAPEFLEVDLKLVEDVLAGRIDSYRMAKQYVHADGHLIWGDLSVSCVRDENGRVENFLSQIIDVTALTDANERNRSLAQHLQQQTDRLTAELSSAAAYMTSIMPRSLHGAVGVSSCYLPARELGGDCFDYSWIDDDHLLIYLIDVSGHGVEPALLAVSVHNLLRSGSLPADTVLSPDKILLQLNHLFQMDRQSDHYFTMWCGVYQPSTRTFHYASAGAPAALAFNVEARKSVAVTELSTPSLPIGVLEETEFSVGCYQVPPGCTILVYSDGASELDLPGGGQLSTAAFKGLVTRLAGSSDWTLDSLVHELLALTPTAVFEDDCSLIRLAFA